MTDASVPGVPPAGTEVRSTNNDLAARVRCAQERAEHAAERAARASEHASQAHANADRDALQGDEELETIHRREAALHEQAAKHHAEAAELQRLHAQHLRELDHRGDHRHVMPRGAADGSVRWPAAAPD